MKSSEKALNIQFKSEEFKMKKILCIILAAAMLMLASCAKTIGDTNLRFGSYTMESEKTHSPQIFIRSETYISLNYAGRVESGSFAIDGGKLTIDVEDSDCVYAFRIDGTKLFYIADESSPSETFPASVLADGAKFILTHEAKA